jgi:hypothetical protein
VLTSNLILDSRCLRSFHSFPPGVYELSLKIAFVNFAFSEKGGFSKSRHFLEIQIEF